MAYKRVKEIKEISEKLKNFYGRTLERASKEQIYQACALCLRDKIMDKWTESREAIGKKGQKLVVYMSAEFLMGRALVNNMINMGVYDAYKEALEEIGFPIEEVEPVEDDAALGNGGLGRLAACYLDGLATQGYFAKGYTILYEYGIFKQKLVDGWQTEMPDFWLPGGDVWLVPREEEAVDIKFEGWIDEIWDHSYHHVEQRDAKIVKAIPHDMYVAGKDGRGISVLRLWSAKAPGLDMDMFNQGDYMRAMEHNAMAEVISKVLYPADNHPEGKSLRLRQQYFLVSSSVQDIINNHLRIYGRIDNLAEKVAIHINDTHPTLAIPELMRILLDECGYGWDEAWKIVTNTIAYTNHTVMTEALECWPEDLFKRLLPRIYGITKEIDNRWRSFVWASTGDADKVERMAIVSNGIIRMANMSVAGSHSVNGVSALHSEILKQSVFSDFYSVTPAKFKNVTNGIAHRRWLCQSNPELTALITELIGDKFIYDGAELEKLRAFADDKKVLKRIEEIKFRNKQKIAKLVKERNGIELDPNSIFDVQVKRLHEYKRQHLNAFHILSRYLAIKENPDGDFTPHTYIFAAKAASGYYMAKKIISFICALGDLINNDPDVRGRLKVVYLEDYNVSMAEALMPAADISEQISLSGTEASGTGNMKLMINGAVTLGTMDGANVEIHEAVGEDNIIIFGMSTPEVNDLKRIGYNPRNYYQNNADLRRVIDFINNGIAGKTFPEISGTIVNHDPYMVLADFADYKTAQLKAEELYKDREAWNRMSLINIAGAGRFACDRAINEYARDIWHTAPLNPIEK